MIFYCSTCDLSYYNHHLIIATRPLGKPTSNIIITERSPGKYAIIIKFYDTCGNEFIFLYLAPQSIYSLENKPQICKIWMKYVLFACSPQSFSKTSGTRLPDILFLTAIVFSSQQLIHGSRIDGVYCTFTGIKSHSPLLLLPLPRWGDSVWPPDHHQEWEKN